MMLTTDEVAVMLKVHPRTVLGWYRTGKLKGVRLGHRTLRFRMAEVEKMTVRCGA